LVTDEQNAKLTSLTVVKPLAHVYGGLDMAPFATGYVDFEKDAVKQAWTQLSEMSAEYKIKTEDIKVRLGSPAVEIRTLAEELEADLIVIGTHGKHGLGLLLGSTANAVLHGVHCDVLAVKIHPSEES
jgi:universal stress protein A